MNKYRIEFRYIDNPFVPMNYIPLEWTYVSADSEITAKHEFYNQFSVGKNELYRIEKIELVPVKE
jgi:hypothetical protein